MQRAVDIGDEIYKRVDRQTGVVPPSFGGGAGGCPSLAHAGTTQLELLYLSRVSGDRKYAAVARKSCPSVLTLPCASRGRHR